MFVANNPANAIDVFGYWKIDRNGDWWAKAVSEDGDTTASLAAIVELELGPLNTPVKQGTRYQWRSWLTMPATVRFYYADKTKADLDELSFATLPESAKITLQAGNTFYVPNTVISLWAGDWGEAGREMVTWDKQMEYLRKLGYKVVPLAVNSGDASYINITCESQFMDILKDNAKSGSLQGIIWYGHGNAQNVQSAASWYHFRRTPVVFGFGAMGRQLEYKLALGLFNSCHSGYKSTERNVPGIGGGLIEIGPLEMISPAAKKRSIGYRGYLIPNFSDWDVRQLIRCGDQGTKK